MSNSLSLFSLIMSIGLLIGGVIAYRYGFSRTANEVQERVINALQSEVQTLHERIETLEQANTQHTHTITTICTALRQRGLYVIIEGDTVYIHDSANNSYIYTTQTNGETLLHTQNQLTETESTKPLFHPPSITVRHRHPKK